VYAIAACVSKEAASLFKKIFVILCVMAGQIDRIDREIHYLYSLDQKHTPHAPLKLAQVGKKTAKLIMEKAVEAPNGIYLELGTSAGLSALHILKAIIPKGQTLHTIEVSSKKAQLAREAFKHAEVDQHVTLIEGDALHELQQFSDIAFCFVDCKKELYTQIYELLVPKLITGGIALFDDVNDQVEEEFHAMIIADNRIDRSKVKAENGQWVIIKH